ncbi:MAG: ATP--guanido phosphotransferase [Selenomonas sp.]|nr:ATP--guanido phosphotransferase [Selenomonas sp.]
MSKDEVMKERHLSWLSGEGQDGDVVLMSRVRLARNLKQLPFPSRADFSQLLAVRTQVEQIVPSLSKGLGVEFAGLNMEELTPLERSVLIEKQLATPALMKNPQHREVFLAEDGQVSLMVNEDDHLRIQCLSPAFDLDTPLKQAFAIDDIIESQLDIAFDEKMGYLTAVPTNLGTGLRASVVLHLPGLVFTKNIGSVETIAPQLGLSIHSLYGEGQEAGGCLYEITNQLTMGFSEQALVENLKSAVREVVAHERKARKALALYMKDRLEDEVWRAYGTLRYARLLTEKETLELLSWVRLGMNLRLMEVGSPDCFGDILLVSRTHFLQNLAENENMSKNEIDRLRAEQVRKALLGKE